MTDNPANVIGWVAVQDLAAAGFIIVRAPRKGAVILTAVSKAFDTPVADIVSKIHHSGIVRARDAAIWIMRTKTDMSLAEIGRLIGDRDPKTIGRSAVRATEEMAVNQHYANKIQAVSVEWKGV